MAHEDRPTAWDDDDLVVTRESLDNATPIPPALNSWSRLTRARSIAANRRHSAQPGASQEASEPVAAQPAPVSTQLVRIGWEGALSLRQKLRRGGEIALLFALTLFLLLGGPGATLNAIGRAGEAINARLHPPKPVASLAQRGYTFVASPPGAYNLPEISVEPDMGEANAAWACWSTPFAQHATRGIWTAQLFYTPNGGAHWTRMQLPQAAAQSCSISADGERSGSALVVLSQGSAPDGSCIAPFLYLTNDTGATWTPVPWPLGPSDGACAFHTALRGGAVYVWSNAPLVRGTNPYLAPTGRLIVSRDAGHTWALADNGLDDSQGLDLVGFRPGGRILATTLDVRGNGATETLMTSDDYGASWRSLGELMGDFPTVYVSHDDSVTDHGGWGPLYELARAEDRTGSPSVPAQYYLAATYIGQPWALVPLPPLPAGASPLAVVNDPLVIGVGPAGALEVERGVVDSRDAQFSSARRLWVWNPGQREWLLDPQIVPGNLELQGASWRRGDQIFWVTTLQLGVPPVLQIYTKTYPANLFRHTQWLTAANA